MLQIIKTTCYKQDFRKKIKNKHLLKEQNTLMKIEDLIINVPNMEELMQHPFKYVYGIDKKKGNLKEIYTAKINKKLRLYMRPKGKYPYNLVEIDQIEFERIDDKHYGEG